MSRTGLGDSVMESQAVITTALEALASPEKRQVERREDGSYVMTPNGLKRIHDQLANKLLFA